LTASFTQIKFHIVELIPNTALRLEEFVVVLCPHLETDRTTVLIISWDLESCLTHHDQGRLKGSLHQPTDREAAGHPPIADAADVESMGFFRIVFSSLVRLARVYPPDRFSHFDAISKQGVGYYSLLNLGDETGGRVRDGIDVNALLLPQC